MKTTQDINYVLKRAVAEIIVREELEALLTSGKKMRLKEGFDPSFPDIHLGHMVALRKLRQFQGLGHQVVLLMGGAGGFSEMVPFARALAAAAPALKPALVDGESAVGGGAASSPPSVES